MTALMITPLQLGITALLVVLCAALSLILALGVQRQLLIAALRMTAQLLIVGLFLRQIFALSSAWPTGLVICAMLAAATIEVGARQERRLRGIWHYLIGGAPIVVVTLGVALLALTMALQPSPWYDARHAIPLVGIILGTVMNSASVALNYVFSTVTRERHAIEARRALGASRYVAFHDIIRRAVRAGLLPIMNQMAAAGIITMPGLMTGQILAGMDPTAAARYQILLLLLLAGGGFLATVGATLLAVRQLSDERERLRLDRLQQR